MFQELTPGVAFILMVSDVMGWVPVFRMLMLTNPPPVQVEATVAVIVAPHETLLPELPLELLLEPLLELVPLLEPLELGELPLEAVPLDVLPELAELPLELLEEVAFPPDWQLSSIEHWQVDA